MLWIHSVASAMERNLDDLLVDRSLDDELPDDQPALRDGFQEIPPDGFQEIPLIDRNNAIKGRERLDAELASLTDEEVLQRGWSINERLHPRILGVIRKAAESLDAENESKKTEPEEPDDLPW